MHYPVLHEASTELLKEGRSPQGNRDAFQTEILRRQLEGESQLLKLNKLCFVDRGLLDGTAYYLLDGLPVPPVYATLDLSHYAVAFLLADLNTFEATDIRSEDLETSRIIGKLLEDVYRSHNIPVVTVPAAPVAERVRFILEKTAQFSQLSH